MAQSKRPALANTIRRAEISITDYGSLLAAAKQQPEPQRLLFVFLKASLPKDHAGEEEARFNSGQGGQLQPIMCADKTLDELGEFSDLVAESEAMGKSWSIVLVAAISGRNGAMPTSVDAEEPLKRMAQTVESGGNLSNYMAFDNTGTPVQFNQ